MDRAQAILGALLGRGLRSRDRLVTTEGHVNRPEVLGPILYNVLGFPGMPFPTP
jgi:hypothetical protein